MSVSAPPVKSRGGPFAIRSAGSARGGTKTADYARRDLHGSVFGRGFDSRRLHQSSFELIPLASPSCRLGRCGRRAGAKAVRSRLGLAFLDWRGSGVVSCFESPVA